MGKILEKRSRTLTGGSSNSKNRSGRDSKDAENMKKRKRVNYRDDDSVSSSSSSDARSSRNRKKKSRPARRSSNDSSSSSSSSSSEQSDSEESKNVKKENKKPKNSNIKEPQKTSINKNNINNNNNNNKDNGQKKKPLDDKTLRFKHNVEVKKSLKVSVTKHFCYACSLVFSNDKNFKNHECIKSQKKSKRKLQESDDEIIILDDDDDAAVDNDEDEDYEMKENKKTSKSSRQTTRQTAKTATKTSNTTGKASKKVKSESENDEESDNEKGKRKAKVKSNTQQDPKVSSTKSSSSSSAKKRRVVSSDESEEDEEEENKKGKHKSSQKQSKASSTTSKVKSPKKERKSSDESENEESEEEDEEDKRQDKKHKNKVKSEPVNSNKKSKQSTTTTSSSSTKKRPPSSDESEDESEEEEKPSKSKSKTNSKNTKSNNKPSSNSKRTSTSNNTNCEFCDKRYRKPEDLKEHIRLFHKNRKSTKMDSTLSNSDSNFSASDSEVESASESDYSDDSSASNYSDTSSVKTKSQKPSTTRKMPDIILITQNNKRKKNYDPPLISNLPPALLAAERNRQGDLNFSKAEYSIAYRNYTQACELVTDNPKYFENRAKTLHCLKMYKSACHDCQTILLLDPTSINGHIQLIRSTLALGEIESCKSALSKFDMLRRELQISVVEECRERLNTLIVLKQELENAHNLGNKQKVLELATKATAIAEGDLTFRILKVDALMSLGRITEAQNECTQILQIDSTEEMNSFALCTVAYCFYQADKLDQSLEYYRQALIKEPGNRIAVSYYKKLKVIKDLRVNGFKGNTKEALTIFMKCLELLKTVDDRGNPLMEAKLYYNCAVVTTTNQSVSMEYVNQAIAKCPKFAKALHHRAKLYMNEKRYTEALKDLAAVLAISPKENGVRTLQDACHRFLREEQQALVPRKDYYKILGIEKSATQDDIKKAYKKKALIHHPDRHANATDDERKQQESEFKTVLDAYGILSDPIKRHMYNCGFAVVK